MDYKGAAEFLSKGRNKSDRPIANNTRIQTRAVDGIDSPPEADDIAIKLHNTDIILFHPNGNITLNTGGWRTVTTRDRINRFAPSHISISQVQFVWYVFIRENGDSTQYAYEDHITITPDGRVFNCTGDKLKPHTTAKEKKKRKELNQIKQFTKGLLDKLFAGNFKDGEKSQGDCFICQSGISEEDHMRSHLKEKYYQRSIIVNAITQNESAGVYGLAPVDKHNISCLLNDNHEHELMFPDMTRRRLQLVVSRYIRKELGHGIT